MSTIDHRSSSAVSLSLLTRSFLSTLISAHPIDLPFASGLVHRFTSRIESLEKVLSCSPRSIFSIWFCFSPLFFLSLFFDVFE